MAREKSPAFQFYPSDFLSDINVAAMTLAERGAYITLLCLCWTEQSLPTEHAALAKICGVPKIAFTRLWPALQPCFKIQGTRLVQPRLDRERQKQEAYRALKVEAGKKGGTAKAANRKKASTTNNLLQHKPSKDLAESSPPSSSSSSVFDLQSSSSEDLANTQQLASTNIPRSQKNALAADPRFDRFWASYPNKKGKDDARKAWTKRHPSEALTDAIVAAVEAQKAWPEWLKDDGRFIPHPATWLNRGSWEDEPAKSNGSGVSDTTRANLAARERLLQRMGQTA